MIGEAGGQIDSDDAGWDFQGGRHLDCLDPEGNVVQLRQRLPAG
jgi:predicted enzyme related to lactoylglutathione lyase